MSVRNTNPYETPTGIESAPSKPIAATAVFLLACIMVVLCCIAFCFTVFFGVLLAPDFNNLIVPMLIYSLAYLAGSSVFAYSAIVSRRGRLRLGFAAFLSGFIVLFGINAVGDRLLCNRSPEP
ncbi:hypothetical protein, partial [Aporhodopirellula aestuarii]